MMLLVCFDLPRDTKENRKEATKYHKKLVELGFTMKQFSVYEREVRQNSTRDRVIKVLKDRLPKYCVIIHLHYCKNKNLSKF